MAIIRSKNDETSPESTVSTLRNCSRAQIKMIKFFCGRRCQNADNKQLFPWRIIHCKWSIEGGQEQVVRGR